MNTSPRGLGDQPQVPNRSLPTRKPSETTVDPLPPANNPSLTPSDPPSRNPDNATQAMRTLLDLTHRLSQSLDLNQVINEALGSSIEIFGAENSSLVLLDDYGAPTGWFANTMSVPAMPTQLITAALKDGPQGYALRRQRTWYVENYDLAFPNLPPLLPGHTLLVAPLTTSKGTVGVLSLASRQAGAFSPEQEPALAAAAEMIALAIRNAQLYTRLRDAESAREHMSNLLVHDIRSPLMATHASIEIVLRHLGDHPLQEMLTEALQTGLRTVRAVVDLTQDLLDVKRLQSGHYILDQQALEVTTLFHDVYKLLQGLALQREVTLTTVAPPDLPAMMGDERLVKRVLVNLLSNALRFTPWGSTVTLAAYTVDAVEGILLVTEDEGPGVAPADRERIFQPFIQGEGETNRGSGLGLAFCREVVLAHNGRIWVEDRPGGGSRFCVWLPKGEY